MLKGVILSEIDSRNGPIKLAYFVTPCSKYMYGGMYAIIVLHATHTYCGRSYTTDVPAVLNVVTTGNGTGTKNALKWIRALGFEFSIQSSVYSATTVVKVSLFSTWTQCTVSFNSM